MENTNRSLQYEKPIEGKGNERLQRVLTLMQNPQAGKASRKKYILSKQLAGTIVSDIADIIRHLETVSYEVRSYVAAIEPIRSESIKAQITTEASRVVYQLLNAVEERIHDASRNLIDRVGEGDAP